MSNQLLNFIWINKHPFAAVAERAGELAIPPIYLENAFEIAAAYPETKTIIWADFSLMDEAAKTALVALKEKPPTLIFKDLNEIDAYKNEPFFRYKKPAYADEHDYLIWSKVDFARILVLDHLLQTAQAEKVFYADFDIVDPQLTLPHLQQSLEKHGMVFGLTNHNGQIREWMLENQFMGFTRAQSAFVSDRLLPKTREEILSGETGWPALCDCVCEKFSANKFSTSNTALQSAAIKICHIVGGHSFPNNPSSNGANPPVFIDMVGKTEPPKTATAQPFFKQPAP